MLAHCKICHILHNFVHNRHQNRHIELYNHYCEIEDVKVKTVLSGIQPATLHSTSERFGAPLGKQLFWHFQCPGVVA